MTQKRAHLTPMDLLVARFGGVRPLARAIGVHHSLVVRYRQRPGGLVPAKHQNKVLEVARDRGIKIKAIELIEGAEA